MVQGFVSLRRQANWKTVAKVFSCIWSWGMRRRRMVERVVCWGVVEVKRAWRMRVKEKWEMQSILRISRLYLHISLANSYIGKLFACYEAAVESDTYVG